MDLQSLLIYLGLAILSFNLAKIAEKTNKKLYVWIIVILLSLVAGLRNISVGIDTKTYDMIFKNVSHGKFDLIYGVEESFKYICDFLLKIWNNSNFLFFIFSFISNTLILFRIWKERSIILYRWSVLAYYIVFFAFSLNGVRQFVAVAIVFYSTLYIKEGYYIKYIVGILFASLFHFSAFIGVIYLLYDVLFIKYFNNKRKIRYALFFTLIIVGAVIVTLNILDRYSRYFGFSSSLVGVMLIAKIIMFIISILFLSYTSKDDNLEINDEGLMARYYSIVSTRWYYFTGLVLTSLDYYFSYMGRIGLYFYMFETIFLGNVFKSKNKNIFVLWIKFGYVLILMYYLYQNIISGSQGEIPYRFFWQ